MRFDICLPRRLASAALRLFCCAMLAACAGTVPPMPPVFNDSDFAPAMEIDSAAVLAPSEEMRRYIALGMASSKRAGNPRQALYHALHDVDELKLEYDAELTRNASETFAARSGNCLSLVLMTAAMAQQLGLTVRYQEVLNQENWSRNGDMLFVAGHVNLLLERRPAGSPGSHEAESSLVIDFLPSRDVAGYRTREIDERTVLAMYMNNRAAETMSRGQLRQAYWWARAAIVHDPAFSSAYNTLAIIQLRHGNPAAGRQTLAHALQRAPDNTVLLANLAQALETAGMAQQAAPLRQRLLALQPQPPFYYFNQGKAALQSGNAAAAISLFARELARDPDYHEFHFWLAQAYAQLGQWPQASRQLQLAMAYSLTRSEHSLYAGKLARLQALER